MSGDERKALSFVAILLGLSAAARAVNRPDPVVVAGATAVDIPTRLQENQQVRERLSQQVRTPAVPAKPPASRPQRRKTAARPIVIDDRPPPSREPAPVYVNRASLAELDALPGISPAVAQRIIEYRETRGRIESFEQLDSIKGVGPALLAKLKPIVRLR
jgi:competence ComEA-like helix-hairpin-helix protein